MQWCVCLDRDGWLSLMTRSERELMLEVLMDIKAEIPSFVVKVFDHKEDAEQYIHNMKGVNKTLRNLFDNID